MRIKYINSKNNEVLKEFASLKQKKHRLKSGLFPVEGLRLAEEAVYSSWQAAYGIFNADLAQSRRGGALLKAMAAKNIPLYQTDKNFFNTFSATETPQPIAIAMRLPRNRGTVYALEGNHFLICDGIKDPGNMGLIFRVAAAAGADALLILDGCVDCFNPKTIRASMGALFHLDFAENLNNQIVEAFLNKNKLRLYAASADGETLYTAADFTRPFALIIGGEAAGVEDFWLNRADKTLYLPMTAKTESLNAAAAASVLLYEAFRQRNFGL